MRTDYLPPATALPHRGLHTLHDAQGRWLQCLEGTLWLTQQDDPRDIVLQAGEGARLDTPGLSVVYGLSAARFALLEPAGAAF